MFVARRAEDHLAPDPVELSDVLGISDGATGSLGAGANGTRTEKHDPLPGCEEEVYTCLMGRCRRNTGLREARTTIPTATQFIGRRGAVMMPSRCSTCGTNGGAPSWSFPTMTKRGCADRQQDNGPCFIECSDAASLARVTGSSAWAVIEQTPTSSSWADSGRSASAADHKT